MQPILEQLERLGRTGRWLLIVQRLSQWIAALIGILLLLCVLDYLLRFPSWFRLIVALAVIVSAVVWLGARLGRAWRFQPTLASLALRVERIYPHLTGQLASAVEFAANPALFANPQRTAILTQASIEQLQSRLSNVELRRLIDPSRTLKLVCLMFTGWLVVAGLSLALPDAAGIAAQRWFTPLAGVEWPRRVHVESGMTQTIWPNDTPLHLQAQVIRGDHPTLRVSAHYRMIDQDRPRAWQSTLLNAQPTSQADGTMYDRLLELPTGSAALPKVELYFEAGDHRTATQVIQLVDRPAARSVRAIIEPPAYAAGLISQRQVDLHTQASRVTTAAAYTGSMIQVHVTFNKPVPMNETILSSLLPGLGELANVQYQIIEQQRDGAERTRMLNGSAAHAVNSAGEASAVMLASAFTARFPLEKSVETTIDVVDEHGLRSLSERRYRLEAMEDKPPTATIVRPAGDEAVLPNAVVEIQAAAQDDVALESIHIEASFPQRQRDSGAAEPVTTTRMLNERTGRQASLDTQARFSPADFQLRQGDVVTLTAVAQDVFDLNGRRHEPSRSTPRRLRIIDEAAFIGQLRNELAGVRQQAQRLQSQQTETQQIEQPASAAQRQESLTQRIGQQRQQIANIQQRVQRNRLDDPVINQMLREADQLLEQATDFSQIAGDMLGEQRDAQQQMQQLQQAMDAGQMDAAQGQAQMEQLQQQQQQNQQQADAAQESVQQTLEELIELLDQGRDVAAITQALNQMRSQQQALAEETRDLMPRTLGEDPDDLSDDLRAALEELAQRQDELADQARDTIRQMQSTAEALNRQGDSDRDQAAAMSLAEAAAMAQREGLEETMRESGEAVDENRLSQASNTQQDSLQTLERMLEEMGRQQERMQQVLLRRLQELAQAIEQLVRSQRQELALFELAVEPAQLVALEPGQAALRRRTMAVHDQADRNRDTQAVAALLNMAVHSQGQAIVAMRDQQRPLIRQSQEQALSHLEEALRLTQDIQQQIEEEIRRQEIEDLQAAYREQAARQAALRAQVAALLEDGPLTRQQRAALIQLAAEQQAIRQAIAELGERVADTMVFRALHDRVDNAAADTAGRMQRGEADDLLLMRQQRIINWLNSMAEALEMMLEDDSPFAQPPDGDDGGGGGGGEGEQPLIPPVAELKLIRELQDDLYRQTRQVGDLPRPSEALLDDLASQQRELSELGLRLIEQMQQQNQPQPLPEMPQQPLPRDDGPGTR